VKRRQESTKPLAVDRVKFLRAIARALMAYINVLWRALACRWHKRQ